MRWVVATLGWLLLLVSVALSIDRYLVLTGPSARLPALAAAFAPYALIGFLVALLLLLPLAGRRGRLRPWYFAGATLSLVGVLGWVWLLAPLYLGNRAGSATDLTVMTANLRLGRGDADTVVRTATDRRVDLLVLEEVTPDELTRLDAAGLDQLFAYRAGSPQAGASGTMVFSAYPLTGVTPVAVTSGGLSAMVAAPRPFRVVAVHTATPTANVRAWVRDLTTIRDASQEAQARSGRATGGPLLVMGDFNATTDHALFRQVLATGLSDVAAQANAGWQPTWPTRYRRSWYRPVVALDHVLTTRRFTARRVSTVSVPDSDHLALVATLQRRAVRGP